MTLEELFRVFHFTDRVHILAPNGEMIFNNFIDLFPDAYKQSTVERMQAAMDVNHRAYKSMQLMPPKDEAALVHYKFSDMEVRLYYEILLNNIVFDQSKVPKPNPDEYVWGLKSELDMVDLSKAPGLITV